MALMKHWLEIIDPLIKRTQCHSAKRDPRQGSKQPSAVDSIQAYVESPMKIYPSNDEILKKSIYLFLKTINAINSLSFRQQIPSFIFLPNFLCPFISWPQCFIFALMIIIYTVNFSQGGETHAWEFAGTLHTHFILPWLVSTCRMLFAFQSCFLSWNLCCLL